MKTLDDVKEDMSSLYDDLRNGALKREDAEALANVAGKYLKAASIELATRMFDAQFGEATRVLTQAKTKSLKSPEKTVS